MLLPVQIAGLVFGASGTFPYFQGCFQAHKFVSTMRKFGKDAADLEARLLVEEYRLMRWGRLHNLITEKNNETPSTHRGISEYLLQPGVREIVAPLLATAAGKMEEMNTIMTRYELQHSTGATNEERESGTASTPQTVVDHPSDTLLHPLEDPETTRATEARKERSSDLNKTISITKKFLWSARDRKAFGDALTAFTECVTKLYDMAVPSLLVYLVEGFGSRFLPSPSLPIEERLAEIEPLRRVAQESDYAEFEAQLNAQVQAWKIETEKGNTSMEILDLSKMPKFTVTLDGTGSSRKRCIGTTVEDPSGSGRTVLIEWKSYNRERLHGADQIKPRINTVTKLLSYAPQRSKNPLLRSTGFFEDMGITNETMNGWIGIIYELPTSPGRPLSAPITLRDLLENSYDTGRPDPSRRKQPFLPSLDARFRLAQKLAEFVLHIHSCGWLHKGLRSDNIIFLSSAPKLSIEDPYIVGWEYSRKEANSEQTESMLSDNREANLYFHPDQLQGESYCREFDHYQLGCLLIEIGHWKSLRAMRAGAKLAQPDSPEAWTAHLTKRVEQMRFFMGNIYSEVTKMLLGGLDSGDTNAEFGLDVVWKLRECNA